MFLVDRISSQVQQCNLIKPLPTILLLQESVLVHIDRKEKMKDSYSQKLSPIMNLHPIYRAMFLVVCPAWLEFKALH